MTLCYINGHFCTQEEAHISAFDLGFLRGAGIFDVFRTHQRQPLFLRERVLHWMAGARKVGIEPPHSVAQIKQIVETLLEKSPCDELAFRMILTKGLTQDGFTPLGTPSLFILTHSFTPLTDERKKEGICVITTPAARTVPHIKSLNYFPALLALEKASLPKTTDVLYVNDQNEILEASRSNFFAFKGNELITTDTGIYAGFTRRLVLKLASDLFSISLRPLHLDEITQIDEAFVTASLNGITPIVRINDQSIGQGVRGEKTAQLSHLLESLFAQLALDQSLPLHQA